MNSYGYIETYGYVTSIVAADTALKTANVTLTNCYFVKGGIVTIEITGDVAAVKAAVEAGSEIAKQLGNYISSNVIARLDKETEKILVDDRKKEDKNENSSVETKEIKNSLQEVSDQELLEEVLETAEEIEEVKETVEEKLIEDENEAIEDETTKDEIIEEEQKTEEVEEKTESDLSEIKKLKKQYQEARVIELKQKVNNLKLGYSWNEIKGMKRKKLIEILLENVEK